MTNVTSAKNSTCPFSILIQRLLSKSHHRRLPSRKKTKISSKFHPIFTFPGTFNFFISSFGPIYKKKGYSCPSVIIITDNWKYKTLKKLFRNVNSTNSRLFSDKKFERGKFFNTFVTIRWIVQLNSCGLPARIANDWPTVRFNFTLLRSTFACLRVFCFKSREFIATSILKSSFRKTFSGPTRDCEKNKEVKARTVGALRFNGNKWRK